MHMPKISVDAWKCLRCGYIWLPRGKDKPIACAKCKSAYWDKPRKDKK